jgi:hypothetical protein
MAKHKMEECRLKDVAPIKHCVLHVDCSPRLHRFTTKTRTRECTHSPFLPIPPSLLITLPYSLSQADVATPSKTSRRRPNVLRAQYLSQQHLINAHDSAPELLARELLGSTSTTESLHNRVPPPPHIFNGQLTSTMPPPLARDHYTGRRRRGVSRPNNEGQTSCSLTALAASHSSPIHQSSPNLYRLVRTSRTDWNGIWT